VIEGVRGLRREVLLKKLAAAVVARWKWKTRAYQASWSTSSQSRQLAYAELERSWLQELGAPGHHGGLRALGCSRCGGSRGTL
jgi:hypothetical protein